MSKKFNKVSNKIVTIIERLDSFIYNFGDKIF